jgi:hypothetical protein
MDQYSIGEAALRVAPRRVGQAAVLVLALGLWANAGWATSLITAVVQHRTDAVVRAVQDTVRSLLPETVPSAAPVEKG